MKKHLHWFSEIVVIIAIIAVINTYLEKQDVVIHADGKGYYDYLPALFIYHDLNFYYTDTLVTKFYNHKQASSGYLHQINGHQVNKYFPGVAILWTPFFAAAHLYALNSDDPPDGYSEPYQFSIYLAALFYLWLGLYFLKKVLRLKKTPYSVIFLIQVILGLATPIIHYVHFEAAFVHVYSFTLINAFCYHLFRFTESSNRKSAVWMGIVLGLILLIRPINILAVLLVFLSVSSFKEFKKRMESIDLSFIKSLLFGVFACSVLVMLVPVLWKIQANQFIVWGYQGESFDFLNPHIFDFLFSFRKGLFVHSPVFFVPMVVAIILWIKNKKYYPLISFFGVSLFIVYIFSSWWSWFYGASFGSRVAIDFYVVFGLMFAHVFRYLESIKSRIILGVGLVVFIPINSIQAYQYQHYIMDWNQMTYEKFKFIGLNDADKYKGVFYRGDVQYTSEEVIFEEKIHLNKPISLSPNQSEWFDKFQLDSLVDADQITHVHILADMEYTEGCAEVIFYIDNQDSQNVYWNSKNIFGDTRVVNTRGYFNCFYTVANQKNTNFYGVAVQANVDDIVIHSITVKGINHR
ncbi:MAG: hypothetical protein ACI9GM_000295 [Salibacteraceae bacterium]